MTKSYQLSAGISMAYCSELKKSWSSHRKVILGSTYDSNTHKDFREARGKVEGHGQNLTGLDGIPAQLQLAGC
jgi:hypothetical protein